MIELGMYALLVTLTGAVLYLLGKREPGAAIMLPGERLLKQDRQRVASFLGRAVPADATHIAWIMLGDGPSGRVHTLYLQTLDSLRDEVTSANSPWGPIIAHSIDLELDIRSRGCLPVTEVMYSVVRVDREGNEAWLTRNGWGARWDDDSIFEVFPDQVR